ncbi:LysR family transcriptional regulator [Deinococcus antarcticus]|uniref:LysR family transcriptional regulator n=1 Tax=Deinococcus antarcticus TaxID=1298767 RepID=A0ABV8AA06_9DEIO
MASLDLFRVYVTVYRAGSVSAAARERHLTQPAVSAHLSTLESRVGEALFTRTPKGVVPTERGKLLYAQVADAVDRLDRAERGLRLTTRASPLPLRLGCPPEFLQGFVLPRLTGELALHVTLGESRHLLGLVEGGSLDVALVNASPSSRALSEREITVMPFVLIGPPGWAFPHVSGEALAKALNARPWVSYSVELPITRRFFTQVLGQKFGATLAMVAPDLRAVVRAVEQGLGASLVPLYAAQEALNAGKVRELSPVRDLLPAERWRMIYRVTDEDRAEIQALAASLKS